jgi:histidine phosphotransferase ChpT
MCAMSVQADLRVIELLTSRLCHDLVGPIAAVSNGAELLSDEDPEFIADAVTLVGDSARKALRRLQFYRFAYGFGGGIATAAPHALVAELFEETPVRCTYGDAVSALPLEWQKLACNMTAVAAEILARGGHITLTADAGVPQLEMSGEGAIVSSEIEDALTLKTPVGELTSRNVGAYFTGLLAQALGCRLAVKAEAGRPLLIAAPLPGVL